MFARVFLATAFVLGSSSLLYAQQQYGQQYGPRHQARQMATQTLPKDIEGTLEGVARGMLIVLDGNSQLWRVAVPPAATVEVTGTAGADYLQSGQVVELTADVDEKGVTKDKVSELKIVSLTADKTLGLFPPDGDSKAGDDKAAAGGAAEKVEKPAKAAKAAKSVKHAAKPGAPAAAGSYHVVGKLRLERGKHKVHTPHGVVTLALADDVAVSIESNDYLIASKGDKVTIKALVMPARPGIAQANDVKIELAGSTTSGKKKASPAKASSAKAAKKDDAGLPEPAADK